MSARGTAFERRVARVTAKRAAVYGEPKVNFGRIVRLKAVIAECRDPLARETLDQLAVKMARLIESPFHFDSWVDIAGYACCGAELAARRSGRFRGPTQRRAKKRRKARPGRFRGPTQR